MEHCRKDNLTITKGCFSERVHFFQLKCSQLNITTKFSLSNSLEATLMSSAHCQVSSISFSLQEIKHSQQEEYFKERNEAEMEMSDSDTEDNIPAPKKRKPEPVLQTPEAQAISGNCLSMNQSSFCGVYNDSHAYQLFYNAQLRIGPP
jgi:hypothetical protein